MSSEALENQPLTERRELALARVGQVLAGRWTLIRVLGIGGTASVYEARHRNGRRAALKVLHPELATSPALVRRFLSEGYAANKVGHEGAVLVLDDGEDAGSVFSVMELLQGSSLAERLAKDGPLPREDVVRIALAILDVLATAHERGVVHRDVKPSNVFELVDGSLKLLDFGVAQVREPGTEAVTQSGFTIGTPAFMAPEQAAGRSDEIDALTDLWAVGATMFQLLTGRLVHESATPNAALVAAATTPVLPIRAVLPSLDDDLAQIVDRALAFRRDERWPNARAMARALRIAVPSAADATRPGTPLALGAETMPETPARQSPRRTVRLRAISAIALISGVALVVARFTGRGPAPESASRGARMSAPERAAAPTTVVEHVPESARSSPTPEPVPSTLASAARKSAVRPAPRAAVPASSVPSPSARGRADEPPPSAPSALATPARQSSDESILDRRR